MFDIGANATGDGVGIAVIADCIAVGTIICIGGAKGVVVVRVMWNKII